MNKEKRRRVVGLLIFLWPGYVYPVLILPILIWPSLTEWVWLDSFVDFMMLDLQPGGYEILRSNSSHEFAQLFFRIHSVTLIFFLFVYFASLLGWILVAASGYFRTIDLKGKLHDSIPDIKSMILVHAVFLSFLVSQIFFPYLMDDDGLNSSNHIGLTTFWGVSALNAILQFWWATIILSHIMIKYNDYAKQQ